MDDEKKVEEHLVKEVAKLGGEAYKFVSPGRKHVTDRLCVLPARVVFFIECKSEDEEARPGQRREIERLRRKGHHAYVVDTRSQVDFAIKLMKRELKDANTTS